MIRRNALSRAALGAFFALVGCGGGHGKNAAPSEPVPGERPTETRCADGKDDDADGFTDCSDLDCRVAGGACALAPALDRTVASTMVEAARFLYTGDDPLQQGVDASQLDPLRLAVIRGKVVDRASKPLPGVRISVRGHGEYGSTRTRPDGVFDLAVNGGGALSVHYEKDGFLAADRASTPGWQRYERAPDVGLVEESVAKTVLAASAAVAQVILGDPVKDGRGAHQPVAIVPASTTATAMLPDGTGKSLASLTVHVTEYPLESGTARFAPGTLPNASAVTYGIAFTVEEAAALGSAHVSFSNPVPVYVENLLGLPVGAPVPLGYYDVERGEWEPVPGGRVVKVLQIADGTARLDTDGDGAAEDASSLDALGVTADELRVLGARYEAGASYWRAAVPHFSTFTAEFDVTPPAGAATPAVSGVSLRPVDVPSRRGGALVEPQAASQSLGVAGTPYSLHYQTSRTLWYGPGYQLDVPVTGADLPSGLRGIHVHVDIAGQTYDQDLPAVPSSSFSYLWNGKDGFDRVLQGEQTAEVTLAYAYDGQLEPSTLFGVPGAGGPLTLSSDFQVPNALVATTFEVPLGVWDANGYDMGGFGLDVLHAYDPVAQNLYFGWGDQKSAQNVALVVKQPGQGFTFGSPDGVTVAADGSVIVTDDAQFDQHATGRVLKVDRQGNARVLAGPGAPGAAGDLDLGSPQGVVVKSDGTVIVADFLNDAVREIAPDGSLRTLVGDVESDKPIVTETLDSLDGMALGPRQELLLANGDKLYRFEGKTLTPIAGGGTSVDDGIPATDALVDVASGVAVSPDGTVFYAERGTDGQDGGHRVRKITPDGVVRTVAGSGSPGYSGDGGPATDARLNGPRGIALGPDGTLFIADQGNNRIREVTTDGLIYTVMGDGDATLDSGSLASKVAIDAPDGIAASPDGTVLIAGKTALYALSKGLPSIGITDSVLPSTDGRTFYRFDSRGKHQATLDAITGVTLTRFSYDAEGHLASVTDSNDQVTTIERDASGVPTAIVAPFGQKTGLDIENGALASVQDDLGRKITLTYYDTGLLETVVDPKNQATTFVYDPAGRLGSITDPTGYSDTFTSGAPPAGSVGYSIQATTPAKRATVYSVGQGAAANVLSRALVLPSGQGLNWDDSFETRTTTNDDGSTVTTSLGPDAQLGGQTLLPNQVDIRTAGGRTLTAKIDIGKTTSDVADALTVERWSDVVTINGRSSATVYTAADRTWTTTTPTGRAASTTLDDHGRTTDVSVPGLGATHYDYDAEGRVKAVTRTADGETRAEAVTYRPDGLTDTTTDALGRVTKLDFDAGGRAKSVLLPDQKSSVVWELDDDDNVLSITPPGRSAHGFTYTPDNLLEVSTPPDVPGATGTGTLPAGARQYEYTDDDRLLTQIDHSDGRNITFEYDTGGRPKSVTAGGVTQTYGYDPTQGSLTSIKRSDGVNVHLSFDGPLWTGTKWDGGQMQGTLSADYDENFWLSSLTVNTATIHFGHDDDGLVTSATSTGGSSITFDRDPTTGMVTGSTAGTVTTTEATNGFGELASLSADFQGGTNFKQDLTRDALGRVTHLSEAISSGTREVDYEYDSLGRLSKTVTNGATTEYGYDGNGNRTSVKVDGTETIAADYDEQDRIETYGTTTFDHTAEGDLFRKMGDAGTTELTYDELGNLKEATVASGKTFRYLVDGFGHRVAKSDENGRVTEWLYTGAQRLVSQVVDGVFMYFVYLTNDTAPDLIVRSGKPFRVLKDHLGSVRMVVAASDGTVWQWLDYDEFGNVTNDTNPGFQPFGFAGGLYDTDTGLVHFGARDYDPETGRWVTKDPTGFGGGDTDLYAYCGNDPVNRIDPSGKDAEEWFLRNGQALQNGALAIGMAAATVATLGMAAEAGVLGATARSVWLGAQAGLGLGAALPPIAGALNSFGVWEFTWAGGGSAKFLAGAGGKVVVDVIARGGAPAGQAGQMLANSLRAAGLGRPTELFVSNVLQKLPTSNAVLENTMRSAAQALGGTVSAVSQGVELEKHWLSVLIEYK